MIAKHLDISKFSPDAHSYDSVIDSAERVARTYEQIRTSPLPVRKRAVESYGAYSRAGDYSQALAEAVAFCGYLDSIATPGGVE